MNPETLKSSNNFFKISIAISLIFQLTLITFLSLFMLYFVKRIFIFFKKIIFNY